MDKWARINYQPCIPIGENNSKITGCEKHIALSRRAATEGIVLLKNNNTALPLKEGARVAVFGNAQFDYIKGGGGSGDVHSEYVINIYDGIKTKKSIEVFEPLSLYYKECVLKQYKEGEYNNKLRYGILYGMLDEVEIPEKLLRDAREFTDTAIITICRFSGEGWDRKNEGDAYFELSAEEKNMVEVVSASFDKVIVLLNTGAMIDPSWFYNNDKISSVLMIWQGGMEGGLAVADVLTGEENPSGKLADTCAMSFNDYPSSEGYYESKEYVKYTEDIFVGYRYFETIPEKKERVVYPFGYGLSYTDFEISDICGEIFDGEIIISANVKNVGAVSGKEVVQVYFEAPIGKMTKASRELCAFKKTSLLSSGESERVVVSFKVSDMASFDDIGVIEKSAYVLEKGEYKIYVGTDVRQAEEIAFKYILDDDKVVSKLTQYCPPTRLGKRLIHTGEYIDLPDGEYTPKEFPCQYECEEKIPCENERGRRLIEVAEGKLSLDDFIAQLTDDELWRLLVGKENTGVANTEGMGGLKKYGIPAPMTADGPQGVRINTCTGIRTTAFPIATMLACTFNTELVEEVGKAIALEMKENNLSVWLAPGMNIHRSPLCGRNFEYFSEDPYLTGKMAAAMVRGVQSQGIAATPKHFACNNKEDNRRFSNSIVSERALREIYLKGFEICVKEADPKVIMTAYNIVNDVRTGENRELLSGILRGEWGYKGIVITDWWANSEKNAEIKAGNDVHMPASIDSDKLYIDTIAMEGERDEMAVCVKRLLEFILWLE